MSCPEHKQIIIFKDDVFELGNIVEVTTKYTNEAIKGRICDISNQSFTLDTSKRYRASYYRVEGADVTNIDFV